jgi:hypothetical protein
VIPMIIVTFLLVLLPTMILTYLLGLIPPLRRNPRVTYGIVALFVGVATGALWAQDKFEHLLYRGLAGLLVLAALAADYSRTVSMIDINSD